MKKLLLFGVLLCAQPLCAETQKEVSTTRHIFKGTFGTAKVVVGAALTWFCGDLLRFHLSKRKCDADYRSKTKGTGALFCAGTAAGAALFLNGIHDLKQEGTVAVKAFKRYRATRASKQSA